MDIIKKFNVYEDMIIDRLVELQIEVCERVTDAYRDTSKSIVSILQYSGETKKTLLSLLLRERRITYDNMLKLKDIDILLLSKYNSSNNDVYLLYIDKKVNVKFKLQN